MLEFNELKDKINEVQTKKRFLHTIGVADTAACLAMRYGYSVEDAYLAGLLHDVAKCLSEEELLKECRKYLIPVSEVEEKAPYLLHGKVGAYYAKTMYDVEKKDILSAIEYHTTGKPDMSMLEKIIFTADYIEPGRKPLPMLEQIRYTAFSDLDQAVYLILDSTLNYLKSTKEHKHIDSLTIETFDFYKKLCGNK